MQVRHFKHSIIARMWYNGESMPIAPQRTVLIAAGETTKNDPRRYKDIEVIPNNSDISINWDGIMHRSARRMLVESYPEEHIIERGTVVIYDETRDLVGEALAKVFTVARKKDGEIVGTYITEAEAQAAIAKAKAAKKATLILL